MSKTKNTKSEDQQYLAVKYLYKFTLQKSRFWVYHTICTDESICFRLYTCRQTIYLEVWCMCEDRKTKVNNSILKNIQKFKPQSASQPTIISNYAYD